MTKLQIESWRAAYAGLLPAEYLKTQVAVALTARCSPQLLNNLQVTVAEGDQLLGFVSVRVNDLPMDGQGAFLDNLQVRPVSYRAGLGRQLLGCAARDAHDAGLNAMWLTVITGDLQARRFYAANGGIRGSRVANASLWATC